VDAEAGLDLGGDEAHRLLAVRDLLPDLHEQHEPALELRVQPFEVLAELRGAATSAFARRSSFDSSLSPSMPCSAAIIVAITFRCCFRFASAGGDWPPSKSAAIGASARPSTRRR
jgi:hypothetical protein